MSKTKDELFRTAFNIRASYINGWQATPGGLSLIYADGTRETIAMSREDAEANALFLLNVINGVISITYE